MKPVGARFWGEAERTSCSPGLSLRTIQSESIGYRLVEFSWVLPIIATVWFFLKYSVDVPFQDQWELPYLFQGIANHQPLIPMLMLCHNEHPIIFPKLIWIGLAFTTKWNLRVDMAVSLLFTVWMFAGIWRLIRLENRDDSRWMTTLTLLVVSLLVFSFVHYGVWLWGFELTFVLANAFTVWAIYLLKTSAQHPLRNQLLAWGCCLVASFSALYGMLSWLVIIPIQLFAIRDKRWRIYASAASVLLLGACLGVYYGLMTRFPYPVDRTFWHTHPSRALVFLCGLAGAPLAQAGFIRSGLLAPLLGSVVIALFIICAISLWRSDNFASGLAWISIGLFALGFSAMTTIGHSAWGIGIASSLSRYMNVAVLLSVATLELCRRLMRERPLLFVGIASVVGILSIAGSAASLKVARVLQRNRSHAAAFLEVARYIDPATFNYKQNCLFPLFTQVPGTHWVPPAAEILHDLGFRRIAMHAPFIESPPRPQGTFEVPAEDGQPPVVHDGETVEAYGSVITRPGRIPPQFVVISVGDTQRFITAAWVGSKHQPRNALATGKIVKPWSIKIPAVFLPRGESVLRAWLYRADTQEFVRLAGLDNDERVFRTR